LRAPAKNRVRRIAPPAISARLLGHITLEADPEGNILAGFDGYSVSLGTFSADTAKRVQELRRGLPLGSFASASPADKEVLLLVHRLAQSGLLEYRLGDGRGDRDQVVIEPQLAGYWPRTPDLGDGETVTLSRFAYLRRRGNDLVLESPRAGALFRIGDPKIAAALALLSTPQKIGRLRRQHGFPGIALLALLVDCQILIKVAAAGGNLRTAEGDDDLVLWDFHDLLFHTHSTEGRQANPLGGVYPYAGLIPPPPAVRPRWPGKKIDLRKLQAASDVPPSPFTRVLHERHSTRSFDDRHPITLAELSRFLECTARIHSKWKSKADLGDGSGPVVGYAARPYPAGGSAYELELYLAVNNCEGLPQGFYHYDADRHALVPIGTRAQEFDALLAGAEFAMGAPAPPQVLITISARFSRVSWKYSSVAYSLILKDAGVLIQTLYLMATDMGLGGCAIGANNIDLFSRMTGIEFHIEGPVGQFAMGRGTPEASD
jgi:SagB-type dehydrogenase family enzyme